MSRSYIHVIKLNDMNKKEIKNAINKAAYALAESMGYEVHDDEGDGTVLFVPVDYTTIDDTITWHRSHHDTCVLNWSSDKIKLDAAHIDTHMKTVIEFYNDLYTEPQYSQSKPRIFTV
jgi:tryptophanyl-tRNA synthetase